jgi:hypothetical protein
MTNPQQKIDEYHLLKPYRLSLVTRFELTRRYLNQGFELELTIHMTSSSYAEIGDEELLLSFVGVRNLELTELGASFQRCLEIRNVSDRQWEGVVYKVHDFENGGLSFLCHDFSATVRQVTS